MGESMAKSLILCIVCNKSKEKENGAITRAKKNGINIYCGRLCADIGRRSSKTKEQKRVEKAKYDQGYRVDNKEILRKKKSDFCKTKKGREMQKRARQKGKDYRAEYIKSDNYVAWKKKYDRKYRAKKDYGEFWECQVLSLEIAEEVEKTTSDYEIRLINQTLNKSQKRKREHERLNSN